MSGRRRIALVAVVGIALAFGASASATMDSSFTAHTSAVAGDCNNNGIGDFSEPAWGNRDDDGDGFCNGVDASPREASTMNAASQMQAVTVPEKPGDPAVPHTTYSGASITLKGIARYGGNQYMWDFGDGSAPTAWTAIGNPFDLGIRHTYTGVVGQVFIATLSVRSTSNAAVVASATYGVKIEESVSGSNLAGLDPNKFDVRARMAVDEGLWYLHTHMNRGQFGDTAPGYAQPYGYWGPSLAEDCFIVDAFERHGSTPQRGTPGDPYAEDARRGLDYLTASLLTQSIGSQSFGNPDSNGNGKGLWLTGSGGVFLHVGGRCLMALADSGAASLPAPTGSASDVHGRTYAEIAQDMTDYYAWAQDDRVNTVGQGGWGYAPNDGTTNSEMERWVVLGLGAAETRMGATIPAFVRSEYAYRLAAIRHTSPNDLNGGAGDFAPFDLVSPPTVAFTAGAIIGDEFVGRDSSNLALEQSEGFIYRHWNDNDGGWHTNLGDSDAMYSVMRAMRGSNPPIGTLKGFDYATSQQLTTGFDWYRSAAGQTQEGVGTNLVRRQTSEGNWLDSTGYTGNRTSGTAAITALDVAILDVQPATAGPVANIGGPYGPVGPNDLVSLDASQSVSNDGTALTYTWDLNGDGVFGDVGALGGVPGVTAIFSRSTTGTFLVCVRVWDGGGRTSDACVSLVVTAQPHPPHAAAADVFATVGVPVQLDASGSFDVDGDPITYAWDLNNDGVFDDATGVAPSVTFNLPGDFPIAVQVTDHPPSVGTPASTIAYAVAHVGAHAPIASAGGPYSAAPGQSISLDASASSDSAGLALTYAWDLNNNGLFVDSTSVSPVFVAAASAAVGTVYSVCVKVTNASGRSSSACSTVTVVFRDTSPPAVTPLITGAAGANGWYRSDVHLTWQVVDAESPIASKAGCVDSDVTSDTSTVGVSFPCSATSAGGTSPVSTVTIKRDAAAPTIAATRTPSANPAGWSAGDVTVTFACDDALSGIAQCTTPTVLHEGAAQSATGTATDNAGNTASASLNDVNVDETGPSLSGSPTIPANINGWYRGDVPVHWTCSDALSGVDGCPPNSTIGGEGSGLTVAASVADRAGNVTAASSSAVRIDRSPPATDASAPSGWTSAGVTVTLAATDNLSGVSVTYYSLDGAPTMYGNSVAIDAEGAHTLRYWSVDGADNVEQTRSISVLIDRSAPTITHVLSPVPNAAGWNRTDVGVSFSCGDSLSGIAFCTPLQLLTGEGASQPVSGEARDNAGNIAHDSFTVSIDKTPPSVVAGADRAPNAAGWYSADVIVSFVCSDSLSGVSICPAAVTVREGAAQTAAGAASDVAANTGSGSLGGLNVDKTAPVVTFTGNAGTYSIAQVVSITCSASDALSGIASTTCANISGPAIGFGLGTTSRIASATDRAGNVGTGSVSFTVTVTCGAVKALIRLWVSNRGIADALSAKVDSICAALNANAKRGKVGAFTNQVAAQAGKTLTKEHANLLEQYVAAL